MNKGKTSYVTNFAENLMLQVSYVYKFCWKSNMGRINANDP